MKTLIIIGIILAVLSLYFVVNADRSFTIKGSEVLPVGTDIAKFILNKVNNFKTDSLPQLSGEKIGDTSYSEITDKIKTGAETVGSEASKLIPIVIDKAKGLIKGSVENKLVETFCPVK
ncbi:MAG: hypothetical protein HYW79_03900 [Parcubacteria group bacterium]|nr:hypothetical protein [Parcubacteria group bacterium]